MNKCTRRRLIIVGSILLLVMSLPVAEKYMNPYRFSLDGDFMTGGRIGGPFHTRSPEDGKGEDRTWSNGNGFILSAPNPPL
jgi:hypothetical protein